MEQTKYMMYCAVLMGLTACNENSIFEGELYKKVVYVLSETDLTFPVTHSLNTPVSLGHGVARFHPTHGSH